MASPPAFIIRCWFIRCAIAFRWSCRRHHFFPKGLSTRRCRASSARSRFSFVFSSSRRRHESGESVRHLRTYGDQAASMNVSRRRGLRSRLSVRGPDIIAGEADMLPSERRDVLDHVGQRHNTFAIEASKRWFRDRAYSSRRWR